MSEQAEVSVSVSGPWKIKRLANSYEIIDTGKIDDGYGGTVAEITGNDKEATARLIAAAPDILAALREMIESFSMDNVGVDAMALNIKAKKLARAAIRKATGGES